MAERGLRQLALGALRVLSHLRGGSSIDPTRVRRILIVQLQQVGDSVIFSPALRSIRRRYPAAEIDLLASGAAEQVYRKSPYFTRRFVDRGWTPSGGRRHLPWTLIRQLRARDYDCVVLDIAQHSFTYSVIAALTGARWSVGFDVDGRGALYSRPISPPPGLDYLRCNLLLAGALDADTTDASEEFWYEESDAAHAASLVAGGGLAGGGPLVVIHPASNWQSKTWFTDRWAALADRLVDEFGARVLFVGTASEGSYVEEVRAQMRGSSASIAGQTDLPQLGALLSMADLFIGTDSGPRHIAGALGTPQVTVMSSLDHPHRWVLARPDERVVRTDPECSPCLLSFCGHRRCMDMISTATVYGACRELLSSSRGTRRLPLAISAG